MKVGDIIAANVTGLNRGLPKGYGLIVDTYEDEYSITYYEVQWLSERQWAEPQEVEVISEMEENK